MLKSFFYGALLCCAGLVVTGCAARTSPSAGSAGVMPFLARGDVGAPLSPAVVKVADDYAGSLIETEGTHTRMGTVTIAIKQQGTKISGAFDITFSSQTSDLTLSGTVKSQTKTKARLAFTIFNPHGRNAKATATVTAAALVGKATVPPNTSQPGVILTFKAKRK